MIVLCYDPTDTPRGRGYWKFNNSLLSDSIYVDSINTLIDSFKQNPLNLNQNPSLLWENLKFKMRENTILYSKHKATQLRKYEHNLISRICTLESDRFREIDCQRELDDARDK